MKLRLSQIAAWTRGTLVGNDVEFEGLQVDSREVNMGNLFCAVRGERTDGHEHIGGAMNRGAAGALVERRRRTDDPHDRSQPEGMNILDGLQNPPIVLVASVTNAMGRIAAHVRESFRGTVVGVTGSAGKTTVKEMIAAAVSALGPVLKSEGNLNTEFGVPMTWSTLQPDHRTAVIEMAMRGPGQIAHLAAISKPRIGVITSLGTAHIGELGSRDAIASAKAELVESLPAGGVAIIPADSEFTSMLKAVSPCKVVTVGEGGDYSIVESGADTEQQCVAFRIMTGAGEVAGRVPGVSDIQARNAAFALAVAEAVGVPIEEAIKALENVTFPEKRMEILHRQGVTIWFDAYNSSPESCSLALVAFSQAQVTGRKVAILGDMLELGDFARDEHNKIGEVAADSGLDELVLVGSLAHWIAEGAREAGFDGALAFFDDAESARAAIDRAEPGDAILMKASRGIELEKALW